MANDKNPTQQLRTHLPATHSERHFAPAEPDASGNPWEALQERRRAADHRWPPRSFRLVTFDWVSVLVWLVFAALAIGLVLLLT